MDNEQSLALTITERAQLHDLEQVIERGLTTFVEVGHALMAIRDGRLYRATHETFEDYCRQRWGFARSTAYQYIDAAVAVENVRHGGQIEPPQNERQTRPLTKLREPEQQRQAWQRAVRTAPEGKVTGAHVQQVVDDMQKPKPELPRIVRLADWEPEPVPEPDHMAVHYSSETPEHYTPVAIIEATRACLGHIDLDPCSNRRDQPNVPATRHFTKADDGLSHQWHGTVYMNPPYGREISDWVLKLCHEHEAGRATEAIALVPSRTDTQWWTRLRDYPVCFIEGRLTFVGSQDPAPFPSAVFYLGEHIDRFYAAFAGLGDIWQRIEPGMFGE